LLHFAQPNKTKDTKTKKNQTKKKNNFFLAYFFFVKKKKTNLRKTTLFLFKVFRILVLKTFGF